MDTELGDIVFVAHGDTNFKNVFVKKTDDRYYGHMDNFMGVHCLMTALWSGRLPEKGVRIEITYGEEDDTYDNTGTIVDFAGARNVMQTLGPNDLVVVIDVTGTPAENEDFLIEKCSNCQLKAFVRQALEPIEKKHPYKIYDGINFMKLLVIYKEPLIQLQIKTKAMHSERKLLTHFSLLL